MTNTDDNANPRLSTPDGDVLDWSVIEMLRDLGGEDDPGLVVELIDLFLADAPKRISEIQSSLKSGDYELLERAAHTLKSSSANLGAKQLSRVCMELEDMGRDAVAPRPQEQIERALTAFERTQDALQRARA